MIILFAEALSEHACAVYSEKMGAAVPWYFITWLSALLFCDTVAVGSQVP